jgi:hypothetical protein
LAFAVGLFLGAIILEMASTIAACGVTLFTLQPFRAPRIK